MSVSSIARGNGSYANLEVGSVYVKGDPTGGIPDALAILGSVHMGSDLTVDGLLNATITTSTVDSTSPSSGSMVINGGMGIAKNLYCGAEGHFGPGPNSASTSTGTLLVQGGIGASGNIFGYSVNGYSSVNQVAAIYNPTNYGLLSVDGTGTLSIHSNQNNIQFSGDVVRLTNVAQATSTSTGALIVDGGISCKRPLTSYGTSGGLYYYAVSSVGAGSSTFTNMIGNGHFEQCGVMSDIDLSNYAPGGNVNYNYFVFTGWIKAQTTEVYTFTVTVDDCCMLYVDDTLLIDAPTPGVYTATITLTNNIEIPIVLEHFNATAPQRLLLQWSSVSIPIQKIPAAQMSWDTMSPMRPLGTLKTGTLLLNSTRQAVSPTSGALIVKGGINAGNSFYSGGINTKAIGLLPLIGGGPFNNVAIPTTELIFMDGNVMTNNVHITGFTQGINGRVIQVILYTTGANMNVIIDHDGGGSTAGNRIWTNTGSNVTLSANPLGAMTLVYYTLIGRWLMISANP